MTELKDTKINMNLKDHHTLLNNFLHNSDFFPKSGAGASLRALRLGDMVAFESNTFSVLNSVEFKSSQTAVDVNNVNSAFGKRFFKSTLVDNQLFDSINKKFYYKSCGDSNATNIQNHSTLKLNTVNYTLKNLYKFIK
jgi:hypothetical protein